MKSFYLSIIAVLLISYTPSFGQETENSAGTTKQLKDEGRNFFNTNMDYQVQAFFAIGGSTPLGMPGEIREINSYNPGSKLGLEANATKWILEEWGIRLGVGVQGRGMKTDARTRNFLTEIIQDRSKIRGYYTGMVSTKMNNTYVNIPISVVHKFSSIWDFYGGFFFSFAIEEQFDGYVSDGYLRRDTPVGSKIPFSGDSRAVYDFSDEVKTFQWGAHIGAEWQMGKHFKLFPRLTYTFNSVLNDDFDAMSFNLHSIYLDLGFGYQF